MAPVIDASSPGRVSITGLTTTTGAFNPPSNALLVAFVLQDVSSATTATITMSNNGTAITWTPIIRWDYSDAGNPNTQLIVGYWGQITTARTGMTVTVTSSHSNDLSLKVWVVTGHDSATPIGQTLKGFSTSASFTSTALTPNLTDSIAFFGAIDDVASAGAPTGTGFTGSDAFTFGAVINGITGYKAPAGASADFGVARNAGSTGTPDWGYIAFEVEGVAGPVTVSGTVGLSATPSIAVAGVRQTASTVGLAATPSITVNASAPSKLASTTLTATPTLSTGNVFRVQPATVTLVALPTIRAIPGQVADAVLTVTPSIAVAGRITLQQLKSALTALPTLSAVSRRTQFPTVALVALPFINTTGGIFRDPLLRTVFPYPSPQYPFRLIAQNIMTGEFVDWDLPVDNDFEYQLNLSGPAVMSGSFKPDIVSVQELGLDGYAYFFHVEISGEIRATAIFLPPRFEESGLSFTCEGFSAVPHYVTWQSTYSQIGVDPFSVIRSIWNHVQSVPASNVGVTVSNTSTPVKLGTPATTETTTNANGETTTRDVPAEPYELMWWDAVNCGEEIDSLLNQAPGDYRERAQWNETKTNVLKYVDLGYPRIGKPLPDLLFNEENIHELVPVQEPEDLYASEIIVIGAGDGVDTIKGYASGSLGGRIRKTFVVTDKTIKTTQRANARALEELNIRRARAFEVSEIVVSAYHSNAPLGSYNVGDDILVTVDVPWLLATYSSWYRVTSISFKPSGRHVRIGLSSAVTAQAEVNPPDPSIPSTPTIPERTAGVGGITTPLAGPNVVLETADRTTNWTITQGGTAGSPRIYDGKGFKSKRITVRASHVVIQNYRIAPNGQYGVYVDPGFTDITIQNNDFSELLGGSGDLNCITFFSNNFKVLYNRAINPIVGNPGSSHTDFVQTWNTPSKQSSSNVIIEGNEVSGQLQGEGLGVFHQFVMAQGAAATDGGGGGSGTSTGWLIRKNKYRGDWNQCVKLEDIHNAHITGNTWQGADDRIVLFQRTSTCYYYSDNVVTGTFGQIGATVTSGPGPTAIPS